MIAGVAGFFCGYYIMLTNRDEGYFPVGTILAIFSTLVFGAGGVIGKPKSKAYRLIIAVMVALIVLFLSGKMLHII